MTNIRYIGVFPVAYRWSPRTKHALRAWKVTLRKLADVRELRVDHLRATRIRHLSQQHIRLTDKSKVLRAAMGDKIIDSYIKLKMEEWNKYTRHLTQWKRDHTLDC